MAKLPEIIEDVNALIDADAPAWVWGMPGIGKSEAVAQIAKARGAALTDIRLSTFDPVDLRGLPTVDGALTRWLRPAIWPTDPHRETILFFDEMDRAATAVANAALQIVLDRRIGEHILPSTVRIVAAGNGATDARTTNKIGGAQANRFTHLYADCDAPAAAAHWAKIGLDPALVAFIRFRPQLIATTAQQGEHAFASPRAWAKVAGFMHLPDAQRHRLAAGTVGKAPAGEFEAFVRMFRTLPSLESIIQNPRTADIPAEMNVLYAVSAALARKADHRNFAAVLTYAERLPREFGIMLVTDAARRDSTLCDHGSYAMWQAKNQDVTL